MSPAEAGNRSAAPRTGVLAVVPDRWDETATTRHHLLSRLATRMPVVWLEPAEPWQQYWLPSGQRFLARDGWHEAQPNLHVLRPGARHPLLYRPRALADATFRSRLRAAARHLRALGVTRIVLYLWRDEFARALELVEHDYSCYHVDDEYSFSATEQPNSARETALLAKVDQVIVHSPALLRKKGGINPRTDMVPNGVDFESFATPRPEPGDLAKIAAPRVGYVGVIKKQMDLALLLRLARARPSVSFVLVGPVKVVTGKEAELQQLRSLDNVHFLGEKPAADLGAYAQHFDLGLMCYEVNDYTRYIYPLKLNEYLATGRPVVSSAIDAVLPQSHLVTIARRDEDWLAAIDDAGHDTQERRARSQAGRQFAREHDWNALAGRVAGLFADGRQVSE